MRSRNKICPCCGSTKVKLNSITSSYQADYIFYLDKWNEPNKYSLQYLCCLDCGLFFLDNYFDESDLDLLYSKLINNIFTGEDISYLKTQNSYFEIISKKIKSKKDSSLNILEFGPDIGTIAKMLLNEFKISNYHAIENNLNTHDVLHKISNLKVYNNITDHQNYSEDIKYDLVIGIHIFDHIFDFKEVLDSIKNKMNHGGIIVICTHGVDGYLRNLMGKYWPPYCAHHPQLFSQNSLKLLFRNFDNVNTIQSINYIDLLFPFRYFLKYFGINFSVNSKFIIPIKLGNIITICEV